MLEKKGGSIRPGSYNVSIDSVQDWEQGRRSPRGAAKTLLRVAQKHPEVLERIA